MARQSETPLVQAQIWRNIARNKLKAGDTAAAERAIAYALSLTSGEDGASSRPQLLAVSAEAALQRGAPQRAAALIAQSFAGVDLTRTTLPFREAHDTAYRAFQALGRSKEALAHLLALKRLDDEATKLATTTSTALMGARFDFANQELRIAKLRADELRRNVAVEQAKARSERLIFTVAGGATAVVIVLLGIGLFTIRRSRNEVRAANDGLAITNAALGKALATKTEFLATTSHEIRTPLNGILGMTQVMLADASLPAPVRDRLTVVHGAGTTMRALVDDILDVAKMETGNLSVEHAPFDLAATLRDAAVMWDEQARAKGLCFAAWLDDAPRAMIGDAARVRQIVFNLLANALKFTERGEVTLTAHASADRERIVIQVADTGIGIPADQQAAVFESFRQADTSTTRRFGGTGLGLAICRNLAQALGGEIAVASVPGAGSTFTVTLPLVEVAPAESVPCADLGVGGATLLVVDRNLIARSMWRSLLTPRAGAVAFAGTAEEAVALLDCGGITRVLIDDATAGDQIAAIATAALAAEVETTLLWPSARADERDRLLATGIDRIVMKPTKGAAVVDAVFTTVHRTALVSQAA